MIIDFTKEKEMLSEDYLRAVGEWSKWLLNRMFGDDTKMVGTMTPTQAMSFLGEEDGGCGTEPPKQDFVIRGKYRDVKSYAQALGKEKDYIISAAQHGEDHPITVKAKAELDQATNRFERLTGVMWPFK